MIPAIEIFKQKNLRHFTAKLFALFPTGAIKNRPFQCSWTPLRPLSSHVCIVCVDFHYFLLKAAVFSLLKSVDIMIPLCLLRQLLCSHAPITKYLLLFSHGFSLFSSSFTPLRFCQHHFMFSTNKNIRNCNINVSLSHGNDFVN